jgi:RecA-family ATPase
MALSLSHFEERAQPTVDWIVPQLLTRQNTAFIMGAPKKACKSWLLLAMAWDLSEGFAPWGIEALLPSRPMRTIYFTQEDTEDDIDTRIKAHLRGGSRKANDGLWIVPKNLAIKLDSSEGRRIIEKEIDGVVAKAGAVDLVMFDPMRRIHNGNENDSETIAKIWDVVDRIHRRYNCGVVISHHITKPPREKEGYDPTDPFNGRGSGDIYGGGDAFMVVVPGPMAKDRLSRRVSVHFESKRAQEMEPAHLKVEFGTGRVIPLISIPLGSIHMGKGKDGENGIDLRGM